MLDDNWKLVLKNDFKGQRVGSKQLANGLITRAGKLITCRWSPPGCRVLCGIILLGELGGRSSKKKKTRFPDKFCPVPPALPMPHKGNVLFPMVVLCGPDRNYVFHEIVSSRQDLEGKLIHTEPKASSIATTVYLKFKCINDLRVVTHNTA